MTGTDLFVLLSLSAFLVADLWLSLSGRPTVSARARYWSAFHPVFWRLFYLSMGVALYRHFWG